MASAVFLPTPEVKMSANKSENENNSMVNDDNIMVNYDNIMVNDQIIIMYIIILYAYTH